MKHKGKYMLLSLLALSMFGCQNTPDNNNPNKDNPSDQEKENNNISYSIQGSFLGEEFNQSFTGRGEISARRGDSFSVTYESRTLGYDDLVDATGMKKKEDGSIEVRYEGKYDVLLSEEGKIRLTRTGTTITKLSLKRSSTDFEFQVLDDGTYILRGISLKKSQKLKLLLDDKEMAFDNVDALNESTQKFTFAEDGFRVKEANEGSYTIIVNMLSETLFTFKSKDEYKEGELPYDLDTFKIYSSSLYTKIEANANAITHTQTTKTVDSDGKFVESTTAYEESYQKNERYVKKTVTSETSTEVTEDGRFFDDNHYYALTVSDDEDSSGIKDAAIIGTAPENASTKNWTVVNQNYITKEDAEKKLKTVPGSASSRIYADLNMISSLTYYMSASNETDEAMFNQSFSISATNDGKEITVSDNAFHPDSSSAASNYASVRSMTMTLDSEGRLTKTSVDVTIYKPSLKLFPNGDYTFNSKNTYEAKYHMESTISYGNRETVSSFHLDPSTYLATSITAKTDVSYSVNTLLDLDDLISIPKGSYDSSYTSSSDADSFIGFQIMGYDPNYLTKAYRGYQTSTKPGTTEVLVGNKYNDVQTRVTIKISLNSPTSLRIEKDTTSGSFDSIYVGKTYPFYVEANSNADPSATVTSSDESIAKVTIKEEQPDSLRVYFDVEILKEGTFTLKAVSKISPSVSVTSDKYTAIKAPTLSDVAGTYTYDTTKKLVITSDGNATFTGTASGSSTIETLSFKVKVNGDNLVLDTTSTTTVTTFTANIYIETDVFALVSLKSCKLYVMVNENTTKKYIDYTTLGRNIPLLENPSFKDKDDSSITMTIAKNTPSGSTFQDMNFILSNQTNTRTFNVKIDAYGGTTIYSTATDENNESIYGNAFTFSDITDTSFTFSISNKNDSIFNGKTYHFILAE